MHLLHNVNSLCPLNLRHPLARGMNVFWLGLPGRAGGSRVYDLAGNLHGTGAEWSGSAMKSRAGAEKIEVGAAGKVPVGASDPFTIAIRHRTFSYVSLAVVFGFGEQLPSNTGGGVQRYFLQFNSNYYLWGGAADWDSGIVWDSDGQWHDAVFISDGTNVSFYRDGIFRASATRPSFGTASSYISAFSGHAAAASSANMDLGYGAIWSRALSASEVKSLSSEGRTGFPKLLNRRRAYWDVPAAAGGGGFQAAWASQANGVL